MSNHLPECEWNDETRVNRRCICPALRACEARVTADEIAYANLRAASAYAAGVSDERARIKAGVKALTPLLDVAKFKGGYDCCGCSTLSELHEDVLAVIEGGDTR